MRGRPGFGVPPAIFHHGSLVLVSVEEGSLRSGLAAFSPAGCGDFSVDLEVLSPCTGLVECVKCVG